MFSRSTAAFRQVFAQANPLRELGFAMLCGFGQDRSVAGDTAPSAPAGPDCYPFPSPWPDPLRVRPFLRAGTFGKAPRDIAHDGIFQFDFPRKAVESGVITTRNRGSSSCVNPSFSSRFSFSRLPAACRTPDRAPLPVLRRAPSSPMRPTTMPSPAPSSVVWPALHRAACRRRNARATDLIPASGQADLSFKAIRASCPDGLFISAFLPGRRLGRERCSRRS